MTEMDLLRILDDLRDDGFKRFKWCLKYVKVGEIEPIKESQLSNAERQDVVDLMVQKYESAGTMEVIKSILKNLSRKDLVRKVPNISTGAEGLGMDLPSPTDAVEIEDTEMPIQSLNSLPLHLLGLSPSLKGQETDSHRYGIFGQQPSQITASSTSQCDNKENMPEEDFQFKTPTKPVSQSPVHSFNSGQSKDAFAHPSSSASALILSSPPPVQQLEVYASSPVILKWSPLTLSLNGDDDNGFLDVLDGNKENNSEMPLGMARPLTTPQVANSIAEDSPLIRRWQQRLFQLLSMPSPVSRPSVKCTNRPGDENTPVRVKRQRSLGGIQVTTTEQDPESPRMLHLLGLSLSLKGQETDSHRYGIFGQQPSQITASSTSQCDNKENMPEEDFQFKTPTKPVSQSRVHSFNSGQSKDAFAHPSSSASALILSSPPPVQQLEVYASSPVILKWSPLTSSLNGDDDDDFLDILDDNKENDSEMPLGMARPLTTPQVANSIAEDSPVIHRRPRSLLRSTSMPNPMSRPSVKRPDHPGDENTPVKVKRQCSLGGTQVTTTEQDPEFLKKTDATNIDFMDEDTCGDQIAAKNVKKKMGIDGNDDKKSDHEEISAPKWKRSYAKSNKSTKQQSDVNNDVQLRDTHEEDDQVSQTVVTLSPESKEVYADALSDTCEVMFGPFLKEPMASQQDDTIHQPSLQFEEDEPVITSITLPPTSIALTTPDTAAIGDEASSSTASYDVCVTIKLHRVILLEEMISKFKDPELLKHPLKYINIDEKGADVDGVSRDVYSAFWTEFMNHTAEGEDLRVPSLSLKWQEEEWKSIGRILLKGFKDHGYFPCRLAPVFTTALIFGENEVSDNMLFESLLLYISQSDRDLITTALKEDLLDEDRDELLDLLNRFNVTTLPTQENLKGILLKVAHKQLIQRPRYAAEKMSLVASNFLKEAFVSPQDVLQMYEDKKPTTRKLLKLLDASPTTQAEIQSFRFLQQYIRGLDDTGLRRMLRFVTGSDVICVNKVEVLFTSLAGLARRPVAHSCGPALELPSTYTSYPELRTEMDYILVPESCDRFSIA